MSTAEAVKRTKDLRFRMAYTKPELSLVLPYGHTTIEEMIKSGAFPDGMRPHPTGHKIWPRKIVEDWLLHLGRNGKTIE